MATTQDENRVSCSLPVGTGADSQGNAKRIDVADKESMFNHLFFQAGGGIRFPGTSLGHNAQNMRQRVEWQVQISRQPKDTCGQVILLVVCVLRINRHSSPSASFSPVRLWKGPMSLRVPP